MRRPAFAALVVLTGALVAAIVLTTPWQPLGDAPAVPPEPLHDFTPAELAREDAFHAAVHPPAYAALAGGLLVALLLGLTPLGARLVQAVAAPFGGGRWRRWVLQIVLGGLAVSLLGRLATLPFSMRAEVVLRRYGLSTQTWGSWLLDQLRGYALTAGLLLVALAAVYGLAARWRRGWWLPVAAGAAGLVVAVSFLYPLVVEPVFNRFTPMTQGPLRASLLDLAARDRVPVQEVLVADASRRTTALNAYVSGFGSTRRIVVYDTLLDRATPDEVRSVVAHELGHAARDDVLRGTLVAALGAAAGGCALALALTSPRLLRRAGGSGPAGPELSPADPRTLALALAVVAALTAAGGPVQMLVSRRVEARADVHALDLTRDPATFIGMQRRLALENLSDLDPPRLAYLAFASHPTAPQRIALARAWARREGVPEP